MGLKLYHFLGLDSSNSLYGRTAQFYVLHSVSKNVHNIYIYSIIVLRAFIRNNIECQTLIHNFLIHKATFNNNAYRQNLHQRNEKNKRTKNENIWSLYLLWVNIAFSIMDSCATHIPSIVSYLPFNFVPLFMRDLVCIYIYFEIPNELLKLKFSLKMHFMEKKGMFRQMKKIYCFIYILNLCTYINEIYDLI